MERTSGPKPAPDPADPRFATDFVDATLAAAREAGASDVHLTPNAEGLEVRWRVDGALRAIGTLPASVASNVVARLKVLAGLLTYRTDIPQEGRIRGEAGAVEVRVSTFPTLFGEKAVVRLFASNATYRQLVDLGLPREVEEALRRLLGETSGAIVLSGPAGGGKTTTLYACLRELAADGAGRRSLASLEDPIEVAVAGVAQAQVNLAVGLDLEAGLKALLRQDPEVLAVGEIRDRATAEVALQAALTGHLVLTTFHAGNASEVVGRLLDMGIEPYAIRSGLRAVVSQRLVRRLCERCAGAIPPDDLVGRLGLPVERAWRAVGCGACGGTGYRGRIALAELLLPDRGDGAVGRAILERADVGRLERLALEAGMVGRWQRAVDLIEAGLTAPEEIRRALGFTDRSAMGAPPAVAPPSHSGHA